MRALPFVCLLVSCGASGGGGGGSTAPVPVPDVPAETAPDTPIPADDSPPPAPDPGEPVAEEPVVEDPVPAPEPELPAPEPAPAARPRVFMGLTGSNALVAEGVDDESWAYVREHLDGIWGNNDSVSRTEEIALFKKLSTRNLITEWTVDAGNYWIPVEAFSGAQAYDRSLVINREAVTLYTDTPSAWRTASVASARAAYVTNGDAPAWQRYASVYTGWRPKDLEDPLTGRSARALREGGAVSVECPGRECLSGAPKAGFLRALNTAHADGKPFIWTYSAGRGAWQEDLKSVYNMVSSEGLWRSNDVVVVINYGGRKEPLPESKDDTVTGILKWLLEQKEIRH